MSIRLIAVVTSSSVQFSASPAITRLTPRMSQHVTLVGMCRRRILGIQQAQANRFLKSQHDKDDRSARTAESFVTSNPKPVPMTYRTPAAFVAAIGNAMTQATRLSNDTYVSPTVGANGEDDDDDEDYTRVNQMSQAAGILSGSNPFKMGSFNFQQALSELATSDGNSRSGLHGACFTWGELCAIDGPGPRRWHEHRVDVGLRR